MKTLLSILMVALFGATVSANPGNNADYLVTKDGKVVVATVKVGLLNFHAKTTDGCIFEANYKDIASFQKDGETYVRKPLYNGKECEGCSVFMKLISWKNGLSLYSYEDPSLGTADNKRFFIFKDENTLWLEVDSKSAETIRDFFSKS
jgi:hypothetical protein